MHPTLHSSGVLRTLVGFLRDGRLAEAERVAGGARYAARIAFKRGGPETDALLASLAAAHEEALAWGAKKFRRLPVEMRRRLREVAATPYALEDAVGGESWTLLRFERPARLGPPRVSRDGVPSEIQVAPKPGARLRAHFRPIPRFAAGVAAAGLILRLESLEFLNGRAPCAAEKEDVA